MRLSLAAFDFGSCGHREQLTKGLTISNAGAGPLEILQVKRSCDCTTVWLNGKELAREADPRLSIAAGGTAEMRVTLSTGRVMGLLHKYVEIKTNDTSRPVVQVPVIAHVHDTVRAIPWTLPQFTAVAAGPPVTQTLTLVWLAPPQGKQPLERLKGDHPALGVTATPLPPEALKAEFAKNRAENAAAGMSSYFAGYRVEITVTPPASEGHFSQNVTALVNGRFWEFPVQGYVFSGIIVDPQYFQFGGISDPEKAVRTIALRSADGTSFSIVDIRSDPDIFNFEVDSDPDGLTHRVTARLSVVDRSSRFFAKVKIRTGHPKKPELEVTCLGFWQPDPPR